MAAEAILTMKLLIRLHLVLTWKAVGRAGGALSRECTGTWVLRGGSGPRLKTNLCLNLN